METKTPLDVPPASWTFCGPFRVSKDELEALVDAIRYILGHPNRDYIDALIDQDDITDFIRLREERP